MKIYIQSLETYAKHVIACQADNTCLINSHSGKRRDNACLYYVQPPGQEGQSNTPTRLSLTLTDGKAVVGLGLSRTELCTKRQEHGPLLTHASLHWL